MKRISTIEKEDKERNERRKEVIRVCTQLLDDFESRKVIPSAKMGLKQIEGES